MNKWIGLLIVSFCLFFGCQSANNEKADNTGKGASMREASYVTEAKTDPQLDEYHKAAGIELPRGFKAQNIAGNLGKARHIAVRQNGDVYVALRKLQDGKGTVALRDTNQDHKADVVEYFGNITGTGIGIYNGYLYRSSETAVYRYPLAENKLTPNVEEPETILQDMPEQRNHAAKPIDFDKSGHMYVNVGAPSNNCMKNSRTKGSQGMDPCPLLKKHGGIWRYKATRTGQTHKHAKRYATGMRHVVALDWNEKLEDLFVTQHGRDQLRQLFPDLYTAEEHAELPAEEMHRVKPGYDVGWPYCYYDHRKKKNVLAPEYGGDGDSVGRCHKYEKPLIGFPGHWAPNDMLFYNEPEFPETYKNGAFVAFHGSWNRAPLEQAGYNVAFVPFENGEPVSRDAWFVFAKGFKGKEPLRSPRNAEHRPMGLAIGPEGALYISDSQKGAVWRVTYRKDT